MSNFDRLEAGYEDLRASWDEFPPRYLAFMCPKCLRRMAAPPDRAVRFRDGGPDVLVCGSCESYMVKAAQAEAQLAQQAEANRAARKHRGTHG